MTPILRGIIVIICIVAATALAVETGPPDVSWGADRLAAVVKSKDTAVAVDAAAALGQLRDSAVALQALCAVAGDGGAQPVVRLAAIAALKDYSDGRAADGLCGALGDDAVGEAAADALRAYKSPDLTAKVANILAGDKKARRRAGAALALGRLRDAGAIDALVAALQDDDVDVRARACEAASSLADGRAVEPLIELLEKDRDWRGRLAAAKALGQLKDDRAVTPLSRRLEDKKPEVRAAAAASLALVGDVRALDPLRARAKEEPDAAAKAAMDRALADIKEAVLSGVKPK